ncbi:IS982 family transposase, partial [Nonomuraea dietziae]
MTKDLNTLATALYVKIDDQLIAFPDLSPQRPRVGIQPILSDAELVTLAVLSALLGFTSERRWLRYARAHLADMFPYLPGQSGYNKRLRAATGL